MRCGTSAQNTAQLWLTLFFVDGRPAENMTLHGAHDFGSGGQIGSVSRGIVGLLSERIGQQFRRVGDTLTIG